MDQFVVSLEVLFFGFVLPSFGVNYNVVYVN